jgi:hypothetical protein
VHATGAGAPVPQSLACMNAGCTCILMGCVCVRLALFLSCQLAVGRPEQCTSLTLLSSRQYDLHNTHILANRKWSCIYSTLQSCLLCLFSFCTSACMVNNHGKIAGNPLEQVYIDIAYIHAETKRAKWKNKCSFIWYNATWWPHTPTADGSFARWRMITSDYIHE